MWGSHSVLFEAGLPQVWHPLRDAWPFQQDRNAALCAASFTSWITRGFPALPYSGLGLPGCLPAEQGLQVTLHRHWAGLCDCHSRLPATAGKWQGRMARQDLSYLGAWAWMVGDCLMTRWNGSISPEHPFRWPCGNRHFNSIYGNNIFFIRWVSAYFKKEKISRLSSRHVTEETAMFCQEQSCHNAGWESTFFWHLTRQLYFKGENMIVPWVHCCTNHSVVEIRNLPLHIALFFLFRKIFCSLLITPSL